MKTILLNLALLLLLNFSFGAYANQQTADVMASIAARSLFDLDNEEMKSIFSPLLEKNSFIKGLRVIDSLENEVFLEFYNKDGMQIFDQFIPLQFTEFKSFESQIKFQDETIGSIIIYTKSENNSFDLTNKEKAWLNKNPIQRVALMKHWPHDSKNNSLHTELLKLINKHVGTNLVPIFFDSWESGYQETIKAETLHGIMGLSWSKEREDKYFFYTPAYNFTPSYLVTKEQNEEILSLSDIKDKTILLKSGSISHKIVNDASVKIIDVEKLEEMYKKLSQDDDVDALIAYFIDKKKLKQYQLKSVKTIYDRYGEVAIGITHQNQELGSIISKAYKLLPKVELARLREKIWDANIEKEKIFSQKELEWINKHPVIHVGGEMDWAPFDFVNDDNQYSGIAREYLEAIEEISGLKFNFSTGKTWNELLESIKNRKIDLLPAIYHLKERENYLNYSKPYLVLSEYVFTQSSYPKIKDFAELEGQTIALVKGYEIVDWVRKKYPKINILLKDTIIECIQSVKSGKSVAFVGDNPSSTYIMEKNFIPGIVINYAIEERAPINLRMASRKGFEILATIINKSLRALSKERKNQIRSSWMTLVDSNKIKFSQTEQEWLDKNKTITYSEVNWKPLSIIENNTMTGIMGDYLNIVAQKTQIEFEYVASNSWPEVLQKFSKGQIDLVPGIGDSKEEVALGPVSDMFASYEMVIISNESIAYVKSLDDIQNKTFSLPKHYTSYNYIKNKYPQANILETSSIDEALRNVANKKADIFVGHVGPAIYYINKMGAENLKIAGKADFDFIHHFLVSPKHPELLSIVNKVFATITEKERERIYHDWIHTEITQSIDYSFVWKSAIVITLIILFFIYNNRKLQHLVNTKTLQLQELLKTLEVKVQERTVDLELAKQEIEEIHQHTQDSIEYASLIQGALIPDNTLFKRYFSDFLTIWQPKDVVGGDIYLFECLRNDDECLLMVIDCTGHGVPGAFVSMLVKAIERQVVAKIVNNEDYVVNPALILGYFNKSMKKLLSQESDEAKSNAGFDGGILYYNKKMGLVKFSGAETALFYVEDSQLSVIKGDRHSIGYKKSDINYNFTEHVLPITEGMQLYITTDGFLDQNGGKKGFPFGKRRFKALIEEHHQIPFSQQKEFLFDALETYQGDEQRNDDITVIGMKF